MKSKILIADDSKTGRGSLAWMAKGVVREASIVEVMDGQNVVELIDQEGIDLVLLDLEMPSYSGRKVIEDLQYLDWLKKVPVCVVTGTEFSRAEEEAWLEAGLEKVLKKPVNLKEMEKVMLKFVAKKEVVAPT